MARLARVVIPNEPHHIIQRGNRRQRTFFSPEDYETYLNVMGEACQMFQVEIWSYCLIPNHIHLICVPNDTKGLAMAIGHGHEAYTRYFNFKNKWRGYLWQGRFHSYPMDSDYLMKTARYIELNPVLAKLVTQPQEVYRQFKARFRERTCLVRPVRATIQGVRRGEFQQDIGRNDWVWDVKGLQRPFLGFFSN